MIEQLRRSIIFEWSEKKITIVSFSFTFSLWKINTSTKVRMTNVICVIVGDSNEKFLYPFIYVRFIKLSAHANACTRTCPSIQRNTINLNLFLISMWRNDPHRRKRKNLYLSFGFIFVYKFSPFEHLSLISNLAHISRFVFI